MPRLVLAGVCLVATLWTISSWGRPTSNFTTPRAPSSTLPRVACRAQRGMTPRDLTIKLVDAPSAQQVLSSVELNIDLVNGIHVATALSKLSKVKGLDPEVTQSSAWGWLKKRALDTELMNVVPLNEKGVGNLLMAIGELQELDPELLEMVPMLEQRVRELLKEKPLKSSSLANIAWGLAMCECEDEALFSGLGKAATKAMPAWTPPEKGEDVPTIVAALAQRGFPDQKLLFTVTEQLTDGIVQRLTAWRLCALCWAYDELDDKGNYMQFRDKVYKEVEKRGLSRDVENSPLGPTRWRSFGRGGGFDEGSMPPF